MKTPEERGPLGAWAYETRDRLNLSVEAVAGALPRPVHPATIRKAEGDSKDMSRPLWRQLTHYYGKIAAERKMQIAQPPVYGDVPVTPDITELVQVMKAQTDAITRLIVRLDSLAASAIRDGVRDALREAGLDPDAEEPPSSQPHGRSA